MADKWVTFFILVNIRDDGSNNATGGGGGVENGSVLRERRAPGQIQKKWTKHEHESNPARRNKIALHE